MAKAQKTEVAVIDKLEELKDYATQTENYYLLGRINRIIEEVKTDEIAQEQTERVYDSEPIASSIQKVEGNRIVQADYHEEDVHEVATAKTVQKEVTWETIQDNFEIEEYGNPEYGITEEHSEMKSLIFNWLSNNYSVPTKKQ